MGSYLAFLYAISSLSDFKVFKVYLKVQSVCIWEFVIFLLTVSMLYRIYLLLILISDFDYFPPTKVGVNAGAVIVSRLLICLYVANIM